MVSIFSRLRRDRRLICLKQTLISDAQRFSCDCRGHALPGKQTKSFRLLQHISFFLFIAGHDRLSERMLRILLCCRRICIQPFFRTCFTVALHFRHARLAKCQCTGLVKRDPVHLCQALQGIALPHEKSMAGRISDACHDRRRRRQHKRTRAKHNENRHRPDDLPGHKPGQCRRTQSCHDDPGRPPVCDPDDLCLSGIRRLYQTDHPLNRTILADPRRPHLKCTKLIHCSGGNFIADAFINREGFPGEHCLIDRRLSFYNYPVHRNRLTRQDTQQCILSHLFRSNDLLSRIADDTRRLRCQMHELLDPGPCLCHGQFLKQSSDLHDKRDLSRRKILADHDRCQERDRDEHIRLDIKLCDQPDKCFHNNRNATQDDRYPRRVKRQRQQMKHACQQCHTGNHKKHNIPLRPSKLQQPLHFVCNPFHTSSPLYTYTRMPFTVSSYTYRGIGVKRGVDLFSQ